jgi:hypothetical protein
MDGPDDTSRRANFPDALHNPEEGTGIFAAGDLSRGTQTASIRRDLPGDCEFSLNLHYTVS